MLRKAWKEVVPNAGAHAAFISEVLNHKETRNNDPELCAAISYELGVYYFHSSLYDEAYKSLTLTQFYIKISKTKGAA